jgi:hypothetical protein
MQKRYQIDKQRAVQQFRRIASEGNPNIQMVLPLAGIVSMLQEGVGHLMREAGLLLMMGVMDEEVRHIAGERSMPNPDRQVNRWGKERGYCVVDGQKVPIQRTRLRDKTNREVRLGSYELFQRHGPLEGAVGEKMMRSPTTSSSARSGTFHSARASRS